MVGVDVNQNYLDECQRRYCELADVFVPVCVDLLSEGLQLPNAELLIADLLIEYIGYACFQKVVRLVDPRYVSCVIQINTDDSFVSGWEKPPHARLSRRSLSDMLYSEFACRTHISRL